ncbi:AraC family transcriptional regulator [Pantoea sp. BAV 3049]|uniref:AraC family transcriptional regulator n=1 Tax=Pantoea sp. BAV 3049 TaxID=2654188 RepID=UPI0018EEE1E5|nr:AraC family transcriptional regulator [Pantoea sp. BAV 3049]
MPVEAIRAHFTGHAYDPHWHDSWLVGVTEQGVQQFHSRRQKHQSRPGTVFLLEPGELHDGDAIDELGFTYRMLYIDPAFMRQQLSTLFGHVPDRFELNFAHTLSGDRQLAYATFNAFQSLYDRELKMVKEGNMQTLFAALTQHQHWRKSIVLPHQEKTLALQARDYLHDHLHEDIGLSDMAAALGVDRFRLSRQFQAQFGLPPHAWLIQLRLTHARRLLSLGVTPAVVAAQLGFADQSHLGRWFRRVYQLTPARYQQGCTNLPD